MIKTVMLVPLKDNEGKIFRRTIWRWLEEALLQFGGFSRSVGIEGTWQSRGIIYRDRIHRYEVSLLSWTQLSKWLEVAKQARKAFRQEALYIEVAGIPEILGGEL